MSGSKTNMRRLAAVVRDSNDAVLLLDLDGTIRAWNRGATKIYGYSEEEVLDQNICTLVPEDKRDETAAFMAQLAQGQVVESFETTRLTKEGRLLDVWLTVTVVADENGKPVSVATTERDISERKRAEAERLRLERRFQEKQKIESLGVLAGGIAHDFNNLLMGVLGSAELALLDAPSSRMRTHLENIRTSAMRLSELTKQMMVYSGKGTYTFTAIDLGALVKEMGRLLDVSFPKKVDIEYELVPDLPTMDGDPSQIRQIVMNLISNGVEAIGDEAGVVTVRVESIAAGRDLLDAFAFGDRLRPGDFLCLEVADNGRGMAAQEADRIFDPFFSTKQSGRGLGLAAVQGIVRSHKGAIKVRSEPGKGTSFQVLFPPGKERPRPELEPPSTEPMSATGLVLVVDDEEAVRTSVQHFLEHLGYSSLCAKDGLEGLELLRDKAGEIIAVLLDLTMPRMNGLEAIVEMRRIAPRTPIILCSGYNNQYAVRSLKGYEPAAFLQKPFTLDQLAQTLEDVVTRTSDGSARVPENQHAGSNAPDNEKNNTG